MAFIGAAIATGALGVASGIGGAIIGGNAARDAAQTQADAANRASQIQLQIFNQQRKDQEPWRQAGVGALSDLANPDFKRDFQMSDFSKDPGYEFRMAEGQKALERSAAARGGLQSGGTLRGIARYGQDYASNEYNNAYNRFNADRDRRFNRLSSIAGLGQTANSQIGAAGQNYANNVGQNMMGAANAQGAAGIAAANGWSNALNGVANNVSNGLWMAKSLQGLNSNNLSDMGDYSTMNVPSSNSYTMPTFGGQYGR